MYLYNSFGTLKPVLALIQNYLFHGCTQVITQFFKNRFKKDISDNMLKMLREKHSTEHFWLNCFSLLTYSLSLLEKALVKARDQIVFKAII